MKDLVIHHHIILNQLVQKLKQQLGILVFIVKQHIGMNLEKQLEK